MFSHLGDSVCRRDGATGVTPRPSPLSFTATAGLLVLAPPLIALGRRLFAAPAKPDGPGWRSLGLATWDTLAVTLAASAAATPILLVNFGQLSAVSPLTNLLLVPLFPAVLACGTVGLTLAMLVPPLAAITLAPLGGLLALSVHVARFAASLPGAAVPIDWFSAPVAALAYAVMAVAAFGRRSGLIRPERDLHLPVNLLARPAPLLALAPAALLAVALAPQMIARGSAPSRTGIEVFNVGGTPVTLVTLASGGRVLVDTGPSPGGARAALDGVLGRRGRLDAVVVTGDLASNASGLDEVVRRFRPRLLLVPPDAVDESWAASVRNRGVAVAALRPGLTLDSGTAQLEVRPARESGRWRVAVREGARRIGVLDPSADAGVVRDGRTTLFYVAGPDGALDVAVPAGGRGAVATDGAMLLVQPPGRAPLRYRPCVEACAAAGGRPMPRGAEAR